VPLAIAICAARACNASIASINVIPMLLASRGLRHTPSPARV
jgi:hypothetical protein